MLDDRLRLARRDAGREENPASRARLYQEEARAGRWVPRFVAGCWLESVLSEGSVKGRYQVVHADSGTEQLLRIYFPEHLRARLLRRARTGFALRQRVSHAAIPAAHEIGTTRAAVDHVEDSVFVREAYLPGEPARTLLSGQSPLDWRSAAEAVHQIAQGLAKVHAAGYVHAAVDPTHLHMPPSGSAWLSGWDGVCPVPPSPRQLMEREGRVVGAPYYLSPDQLRGEPIGVEVDVYGLSATLYTLLTNRLPFSGETTVQLIQTIMRDSFPDPRLIAPEVPDELALLVAGGTDQRVEERLSLPLLIGGLEAVLSGGELPGGVYPRRRSWLGGLAAWLRRGSDA